jgi:hypothetical protein
MSGGVVSTNCIIAQLVTPPFHDDKKENPPSKAKGLEGIHEADLMGKPLVVAVIRQHMQKGKSKLF